MEKENLHRANYRFPFSERKCCRNDPYSDMAEMEKKNAVKLAHAPCEASGISEAAGSLSCIVIGVCTHCGVCLNLHVSTAPPISGFHSSHSSDCTDGRWIFSFLPNRGEAKSLPRQRWLLCFVTTQQQQHYSKSERDFFLKRKKKEKKRDPQ